MATIVARKGKSGTRYTAQIRIKRDGKAHTESRTFSRKRLAEEWAARRETELRDDPMALVAARHEGLTVGDAVLLYQQEREQVGGTFGRSHLCHLKLLGRLPGVAKLDVMRLTASDLVSHVRQRRGDGTGPATVLQDLIWLRLVMRYARTAWGVPAAIQAVDDAADLCRSERLIARSPRRERLPTADELEQIGDWFSRPGAMRQARSPDMYLIMWFAIYSARRQDEICSLRLSDLDRGRGLWLVRDLKHPDGSAGRHRAFVVPDRLWPVIDAAVACVRRDDGRLFPYNGKTVGTAWIRAMHVLGIDDLRFHDLRHEACTRMAEDGLTVPQIQQVSLHESWGSLQRYVNLRPRSRRAEFDSTQRSFASPSGPGPGLCPDTPPGR